MANNRKMANNLFFLDSSDEKKVLAVISDLNNYIDGSWALAGSISYRLQIPDIQTSPGLRDLDISIYPKTGQNPKLIVSQNVTQAFYVIHIDNVPGGYYFRFIHKKSGIHVDYFTPSHTPAEFGEITLNGMKVKTICPEENLYHLFYSILRKNFKRNAITQKTVDNAKILWSVIDQNKLMSLLKEYRAEYEKYLPENIKKCGISQIVTYILSQQATFTACKYSYPANSPTTLNGISVENEKKHRKVLGVRNKRAGLKERLITWLKMKVF